MAESFDDNLKQSTITKCSLPMMLQKLNAEKENVLPFTQMICETRNFMESFRSDIENNTTFDHIFFLLKSALPVGRMFSRLWPSFYPQVKEPRIHYVNFGRIAVNDPLFTYNEKTNMVTTIEYDARIKGPSPSDLAVKFGFILPGNRLLIVDEFSRTGSTLRTADMAFKTAFPKAVVSTKVVYSKEPYWNDNPDYLGIEEADVYRNEIRALDSLNRKFHTEFESEYDMMGDPHVAELRQFYFRKLESLQKSIYGVSKPEPFDRSVFEQAKSDQLQICQAVLELAGIPSVK
jgi:hypoxanthine phosphoribosyltransferase